jgi:hypothetical protein
MASAAARSTRGLRCARSYIGRHVLRGWMVGSVSAHYASYAVAQIYAMEELQEGVVGGTGEGISGAGYVCTCRREGQDRRKVID